MEKIDYDARYFNPRHTLECGQIFRFEQFGEGYLVFSGDKACYVYSDGVKTCIECEDAPFFYDFFDLARDYSAIVEKAISYGIPLLTRSAQEYSGLRLLNQQKEEMIYSFIISQNNNIPRIKGIISRICKELGERREFMGREYFTFPTTAMLAEAGVEFFKRIGCGYRDKFIDETARRIAAEGTGHLDKLDTRTLKKTLLGYKGIGGKVADCVSLFGFSRRDSFPVDVWVEKVYKEDFGGTLTDREKMSAYFTDLFKENSGYVQQYLFYGKRQNL